MHIHYIYISCIYTTYIVPQIVTKATQNRPRARNPRKDPHKVTQGCARIRARSRKTSSKMYLKVNRKVRARSP